MWRGVVLLSVASQGAHSFASVAHGRAAANPIRKVVTMLQSMQQKIEAEAEKEEGLYKKFMCYCKNSGSDLKSSIESAEEKGPQLESEIKAAEEQKTQLEEDLKKHKADRQAAKASVKEATALREKEAAAFAGLKGEKDSDIAAIEKAVAALEKGMGGAFLQTGGAHVLKQLIGRQDLAEEDRQEVMSFLSAGVSYSPQSGVVVGILKQLGESMGADLAEATAAEEAAIKAHDELVAAKKKEIEALTASIETKTQRSGEVAVSIVQLKDDMSDTEAALVEDKKFLAELEAGCSSKTAEWEERVKVRQEELLALADTIKVLNDDDALDLFKKTLPSPSSSFLQLQERTAATRKRSLEELSKISTGNRSPQVDLIFLALRGKKIGFEKVISMIDAMVETLKTEQVDDGKKREYCGKEFDEADDKKKAAERAISDAESAVAKSEEGIESLTEEIASLGSSIKALDKSVAEATEQRKEEHSDYTELMASDAAAKELLEFAKNRLNKFYNPKLYKPPPKQELSAEDQIVVNMGGAAPTTPAPGGIAGTGIAVLAQVSLHRGLVAPPPPPETFGAYSKKSEEGTGVIAMIDLLVKDLTKEMTEAKTEEKLAQEDYEKLMSDSAEKRAQDSKSLTQKEAAKADMEAALETHVGSVNSSKAELMATEEYIASLHGECDWLLKYFDARKAARSTEIESLQNAKAVLSGADYSLLSMNTRRFLSK